MIFKSAEQLATEINGFARRCAEPSIIKEGRYQRTLKQNAELKTEIIRLREELGALAGGLAKTGAVKKISRYDLVHELEDGDWVRYSDHVLEVLDYQQAFDSQKEEKERYKNALVAVKEKLENRFSMDALAIVTNALHGNEPTEG